MPEIRVGNDSTVKELPHPRERLKEGIVQVLHGCTDKVPFSRFPWLGYLGIQAPTPAKIANTTLPALAIDGYFCKPERVSGCNMPYIIL